MKSKLTNLLLVAVMTLIGLPVFAQELRANVPFDFVVNGKTIPAGQLRITRGLANYAVLMNVKAHKSAVCAATDMGKSGDLGRPKLVFYRYGSEYLLAEIWSGEKAERVLATSKTRHIASTRPDEEIVIALASPTSGHGR
jgi:hypothetical protein